MRRKQINPRCDHGLRGCENMLESDGNFDDFFTYFTQRSTHELSIQQLFSYDWIQRVLD